jgi:chemosensory pili system protein ChpC
MSTETAPDIEIRGVLLPLREAQLLLPNASVSEVVSFTELTSVPDMPNWFLGILSWRQREVPVISFEELVEVPSDESRPSSKIAICNTLGGNPRRPFIGLLLSSMPKLVRVTQKVITPLDNEHDLGAAVKRQVVINGEEAWIPDMNSVEWVVQEALS